MRAENIKKLIKNTKVKTNPEVDKAVLNDLLVLMDKPKNLQINVRPNIWRIIMQSRITKLAGAAMVIFATIVGINFFLGSGTSSAFAKALEYFAAAQTARFDLTIEFAEQKPQTSSFLYDAKGYIRQNMANGVVNFVDYNTNKVTSLVPETKTVIIRDVNNPDFNTALYDIFTRLQDFIQQAIYIGYGPVKSIGTKNIDGSTAYGYSVETTGQSPGLFWQGKGTLTIWADAETDFPLILKWHNSMTNIIATVSNIHLNEVFSLDELSIAIPKDYTIQDETLPSVKPEPQLEKPQTMQETVVESNDIPEDVPQLLLLNQPPDFNVADLTQGLGKNDQALIKFFYSWAFLSKGKFPSSLTVNAIKDIDPNAEINLKQELWSYEFSANMPSLFNNWKPDIDPNDYTKEEIAQAKDKHGRYYEDLQKKFQELGQTYRPIFGNIVEGLKLINELPANSDWHYNGAGISFGDSDTAIFWYKPKGSDTYRVIYGNLTIEDFAEYDLYVFDKSSEDKIDKKAKSLLETVIQLGADIPKDKRNKVLRMMSLKEKDLIKGLATYLEYSNGKYPSAITLDKSFMKNLDALFTKAVKEGRIDKKTSEENVFDIFYAASFYAKLEREKKEPVYYGNKVTISDPNAILVRWKLSKNKYRVIYTSLKAETVTAEKLAELEKQ